MTTKSKEPEVVEAEVINDQQEIVLAVNFQPAVITADFEGMGKKLDELLAPYEGLTAENALEIDYKQAKTQRAWLNKLKNNELESPRKAIKKEYNAAYNAFEAEIKKLVSKIDFYIGLFDGAIKQHEAAAKEQRRNHLVDCYADYSPALVEVVPFERLLEPKWLNASFGEVKAENALFEKVTNLANDWEQLKKLKDTMPYFEEAQRELFRTLSLSDAVAKNKELVDEQRRIDEMNRQIEEAQQYQQGQPEDQVQATPEPPQSEQVPVEVYQAQPVVKKIVLNIEATDEQFSQLVDFMKSNGIHGTFKEVGYVQ